MIAKLWDRYAYVILLLIVVYLCGIIYINTLTKASNSEGKVEIDFQQMDEVHYMVDAGK